MANIWRGRTYHLPSGTLAAPDKKHLFVILTEPDHDGDILAVSLTSTIDKDQTCVLHKGDHPFINRVSYVNYYRLEIVNERFFLSQAHNKDEDMKDEILTNICDGLTISDFVEPQFIGFYIKQNNTN